MVTKPFQSINSKVLFGDLMTFVQISNFSPVGVLTQWLPAWVLAPQEGSHSRKWGADALMCLYFYELNGYKE